MRRKGIKTTVKKIKPDYNALTTRGDPFAWIDNAIDFLDDYGFIVNPNSQFRREQLARMILNGNKLAMFERQEIFYLLTGRPVQRPKRGRPSTSGRDFYLALQYIIEKKKNGNKPNILREKLIKEYDLPPGESTFYMAVNRGVKILKKRIQSQLDLIKRLRKGEASEDEIAYFKEYYHAYEEDDINFIEDSNLKLSKDIDDYEKDNKKNCKN
ncbi:MAG: hypothetical protein HGJ94_04225 [Desulfosarcina sp.]|nr:hypothetical protein [Desulfosarcina sp.]MBC2743508.1 hypothetical protein [Desulfosarcina sp.]MBC2766418.1 hypothetical protein [Desulfosarcina sp.]